MQKMDLDATVKVLKHLLFYPATLSWISFLAVGPLSYRIS